MGTLYYGAAQAAIVVDDRTLAHLKTVATSKLRRNESFLVSWEEAVENGSGRGSIWLHPATDLLYRFEGSRAPELDPELLESMSMASMSGRGIVIEASLLAMTPRRYAVAG